MVLNDRESHLTKTPMVWTECQLTESVAMHYMQGLKERKRKANEDYDGYKRGDDITWTVNETDRQAD